MSALVHALRRAGFGTPEVQALRSLLTSSAVIHRVNLVDDIVVPAVQGQFPTLDFDYKHHTHHITFTPPKVWALCYNLTFDKSPSVRRKLAEILAEYASEEWMPCLGWLSKDRNPEIQNIAYRGLDSLEGEFAAVMRSLHANVPGPFVSNLEIPLGRSLVVPSFSSHLGKTLVAASQPVSLNLTEDSVGISGRPGSSGSSGSSGSGSSSGGSIPPDGGSSPSGSPPFDNLHRFTQIDFMPATPPASGYITFSLRVSAPSSEGAHAVDVRVPTGQAYAVVLVHASSVDFDIAENIKSIKVLRNVDSEEARFQLHARLPVESGAVSLLVYDEFGLIGSIEMRLRAKTGQTGLETEKLGPEIFRDPSSAQRNYRVGHTIQVSVGNGVEKWIEYHLLKITEAEGLPRPELLAVGHSARGFNESNILKTLKDMRDDVVGIEGMLGTPGAASGYDMQSLLETFRIKLESAGDQLAENLVSPQARTVLSTLKPGTIINWAIANQELDGIPWELICDPVTGNPLARENILMRVPVRKGNYKDKPAAAPATTTSTDGSVVQVIGQNVAAGDRYDKQLVSQLRDIIGAAPPAAVVTNLQATTRAKVSLANLSKMIQGARVVHLLCHGVSGPDDDVFLKMENETVGYLRPGEVRKLKLAPGALVFANACSSSTPAFSVAGLTTFGWEFINAGAAVYIGTLAPVTTTLAMQFAKAFFDAYLGQAKTVPDAIFEARKSLVSGGDPTWMLYSFYGEAYVPETAVNAQK